MKVEIANEELILTAKSGDLNAKDQFFEQNKKFPAYIARKFENTGVDIDDLISIATVGMMKAYHSFDPEKAIKFASYSSRCMENEILMYLRKNSKKDRVTTSLDGTISTDWDGNELTLKDVVGSGEDVAHDFVNRKMATTVLELIDTLPEKYRVVAHEFLINDKSQLEVSKILGLSQSYVSRMGVMVQEAFQRYRDTGKFAIKKKNPSKGKQPREVKKKMGRTTKVDLSKFKYITEKYPDLTMSDISSMFGVSYQTACNYNTKLSIKKDTVADPSVDPIVQEYLTKKQEKSKPRDTDGYEQKGYTGSLPRGREIGKKTAAPPSFNDHASEPKVTKGPYMAATLPPAENKQKEAPEAPDVEDKPTVAPSDEGLKTPPVEPERNLSFNLHVDKDFTLDSFSASLSNASKGLIEEVLDEALNVLVGGGRFEFEVKIRRIR